MSEQRMDQQTLMYVLIGVVVVLVAIFGYMVYARSQPQAGIPVVGSAGTAQPAGAATDPNAAATAPGQQAPATPATPSNAAVDPKTSPKVTGAPKDFVTAYYTAGVKGQWAKVFNMLPPATRQTYGTADQFAAAEKGYGISSFKVLGAQTQGDVSTVQVSIQTSAYGALSNVWTFKKVAGSWYVADKKTNLSQ